MSRIEEINEKIGYATDDELKKIVAILNKEDTELLDAVTDFSEKMREYLKVVDNG